MVGLTGRIWRIAGFAAILLFAQSAAIALTTNAWAGSTARIMLGCGDCKPYAPSEAEPPKSDVLRASGQIRDETFGIGPFGGLEIDFDVVAKITTLLDEPVVQAKMRWNLLDSSTVKVPTARAGLGWEYREARLGDLGEEAKEKISITRVEIDLIFTTPNSTKRYAIRTNIGVLALGDGTSWSYNTPGSPEWDRLIFEKDHDAKRFVSEPTAKALYTAGLTLDSVKIRRAEVSDYPLKSWYWTTARISETTALTRSIRTLMAGLYKAYGFRSMTPEKTDLFMRKLRLEELGTNETASISSRISYWERLVRVRDKLRNLPKDIAAEKDDGLYSTVKSNADSAYNEAIASTSFTVPDTGASTIVAGKAFDLE